MLCICGHDEDIHEELDGSFEELVLGECTACKCTEFCEEIDEEGKEI